MKISVVTPTLRDDAAFRLTRDSIAAQCGVDVEHIVVSPEEFHDTDFRSVVQPRQGVYAALNLGTRLSTGDVVGLLHAGDTYASDKVLTLIARAFETDPDLDYVYADIQYVSGPARRPTRIYRGLPFDRKHALRGALPPHPSLYVRRRAVEALGPYDTSYIICGDTEMWLRILERPAMRGRYLPRVTVMMAAGGLSTQLRSRLLINQREKLRALRAHGLPASLWRLALKYIYGIPSLFKR